MKQILYTREIKIGILKEISLCKILCKILGKKFQLDQLIFIKHITCQS